jgi:hypothetical protein
MLPPGNNPSDKSVNSIRLVKPSIAAAAFGDPHSFDGSPGAFKINRGSVAGDMTSRGPIKSFRPYPPT